MNDALDEGRTREEVARSESALRDAAAEWRSTFDGLELLILIVDDLERVQRLNRAAAIAAGRDFHACLGQNIGSLGVGQPWQAMKTIAAERPEDPIALQVRDDETGCSWEITGIRMTSADREHPRMILSARDISDFVELESFVRQWEKLAAIGELTAGVAHEVRNPLFSISAGLDALGMILNNEEKVANLLAIMRREVTRMKSLMDDLLDYGKSTRPANLTDDPVSSAVELGVRSCEALATAAGVSLFLKDGDQPWTVRMDRGRLSQVVTNLAANAVQHSPAGSTVVVEIDAVVRNGREWARCTTRDSGAGFPAADIPRLFEPFFSRRAGGTGLGLSIAQRIVLQHGGTISAGNRPEGGAEVSFELPTVMSRAREGPDLSS